MTITILPSLLPALSDRQSSIIFSSIQVRSLRVATYGQLAPTMIPHFAVPRTTVVYADYLYVCWHRLPVRALAITSPRRLGEAQTSDLKRSGYQAIIEAGQSMCQCHCASAMYARVPDRLRPWPFAFHALMHSIDWSLATLIIQGPGTLADVTKLPVCPIRRSLWQPQVHRSTGVQFENKSQESRVKTALPVPASGNRDSRFATRDSHIWLSLIGHNLLIWVEITSQ